MPDSFREWVAPLLALIGGGGITALFQAWRKPSSKAEDVAAEATADKARTEAWQSLLQSLEGGLKSMESRLGRVEAEAEQCHRENAAFRKALAERDETIADLTSQVKRQDEIIGEQGARIKRLEGQLEARDLRDAAQSLPGTFATLDKDRVTVMRPRKGGAQ